MRAMSVVVAPHMHVFAMTVGISAALLCMNLLRNVANQLKYSIKHNRVSA